MADSLRQRLHSAYRRIRAAFPGDRSVVSSHDYTERARRAVGYAVEEAGRRQAPLCAAHLMLGLLREEDNLAATTLAHLGVDLTGLRTHIETHTRDVTTLDARDRHALGGTTPGWSLRGERITQLAVQEAGRFGHKFIGPEHLLLACLYEEEHLPDQFRLGIGVGHARVLAALQAAFTHPGAVWPPPPDPRGYSGSQPDGPPPEL